MVNREAANKVNTADRYALADFYAKLQSFLLLKKKA